MILSNTLIKKSKINQFNDWLNFDSDHQRNEISFITPNVETFFEKTEIGWTFKKIPEGFLMRAPEEWLVDLTDPYKINFCGTFVCNLAYFKFLKSLI
jgi:hypothetical protein